MQHLYSCIGTIVWLIIVIHSDCCDTVGLDFKKQNGVSSGGEVAHGKAKSSLRADD